MCYTDTLSGLSRRYFVPVEDSTEETLWNNGGECEESFEGIQNLISFVYLFIVVFMSETWR